MTDFLVPEDLELSILLANDVVVPPDINLPADFDPSQIPEDFDFSALTPEDLIDPEDEQTPPLPKINPLSRFSILTGGIFRLYIDGELHKNWTPVSVSPNRGLTSSNNGDWIAESVGVFFGHLIVDRQNFGRRCALYLSPEGKLTNQANGPALARFS